MAKAGHPLKGKEDPTRTVRVRINSAKEAITNGWEVREVFDLGLKTWKEQENKKVD